MIALDMRDQLHGYMRMEKVIGKIPPMPLYPEGNTQREMITT